MIVEQAYRTRLGAVAPLVSQVGDRMYPGVIPDHDTPTPWFFFAVVASVPIQSIDGPSTRAIHTVEFDVYSETYIEWKAIEAEIIKSVEAEEPFDGISLSAWVGSIYEAIEGGHHGTVTVTCHGPTNLPA